MQLLTTGNFWFNFFFQDKTKKYPNKQTKTKKPQTKPTKQKGLPWEHQQKKAVTNFVLTVFVRLVLTL